ncbi:NAD(P)/FAD-dependent oxidoreductase [Nodosilinea sp. E11]|uniref:NAD(P)/FAD-dependent oxidoreductase n=1 Tax=Nodosilinea sp. E11 TaxID=3037479 RepID=UPI0029346EDE|nr:NAD(P)/FAD-dependent oxidoreductase [Nodosilinea sp. E11]WOD38090.1 NAD(P)/FAD-dependent oxidoreductase [Nodosilinea sp. E11]
MPSKRSPYSAPGSVAPTGDSAVRVCILGGGFGGLYCALALHQHLGKISRPVHITLVEPRDRFNFTPLLYELLTQELAPWEIAPAYTDLLKHTAVDLRQDWAEQIDLAQRRVTLRQGSPLTYDYLVVALGSQLRPPLVAGSQAHSLPFNSLGDAERLERRLGDLAHQPTVQVVVAGAGPSGVELACKLSDRLGSRGHVTVVDRRGEILRSYPERVQRAAGRALGKRGIAVYLNAAIDGVDATGLTFGHGGQPHHAPADIVLWTVGTVPRPWLGGDALKPTPFGQYPVRPTLQLLDHNNVFVLGDMAAMPAPGRERAPLTAQAAYQAAPVVAHNLAALIAGRSLKPFVYHHLGDMLTLGQGEAVVCGFGLCITGRLGAFSRRWAYWLRLPTMAHRWRVLKHRLGLR